VQTRRQREAGKAAQRVAPQQPPRQQNHPRGRR
jgi:hypothetical protein